MFTDERIIEASRDFVCAADEVWRLQRGSEADCVFFQHMVNGGKRITDRGSRQGVWVCAPSGKLLSHVNTRNIERLLDCLDDGFAAWNALADGEKRLAPDVDLTPAHRWEINVPRDGLILERIGRELTAAGLGAEPHASWNRDFAWFSAAELNDAMSAAGHEGETFALPRLADRLARFHLIDNVRGQSLPFAPSEITTAELAATVVSRDSTRVTLTLEGHTAADADGPWLLGDNSWKPTATHPHGIECELVGRAVWNESERRFESFELVAVGRRWGRTVMNGRGGDASPGLIAFHFEMSATVLAPTFIAVYDADWVEPPAIGAWRDAPEECGLDEG